MSTQQKESKVKRSDYIIILIVSGCASLVVCANQLGLTLGLIDSINSGSFTNVIFYFSLAIGLFIAAGLLKMRKRLVVYLLTVLAISDLFFDFLTGRGIGGIAAAIWLFLIWQVVVWVKVGELS